MLWQEVHRNQIRFTYLSTVREKSSIAAFMFDTRKQVTAGADASANNATQSFIWGILLVVALFVVGALAVALIIHTSTDTSNSNTARKTTKCSSRICGKE